jgi:hypothetical protein
VESLGLARWTDERLDSESSEDEKQTNKNEMRERAQTVLEVWTLKEGTARSLF